MFMEWKGREEIGQSKENRVGTKEKGQGREAVGFIRHWGSLKFQWDEQPSGFGNQALEIFW